ncbi:MAG: FAD-dependent oxidoreductase, partial [Deltaproteobacteria bacterium]|nr:FAD-dependent oxidoreductase [Deltaproteobacteria bacterium]
PVFREKTCSGVFPVRYYETARETRQWLSEHPQVVVLGGGLVGVKTAVHLAHAGHKVTIIEKEDHLLPRAISAQAARFVQEHLEKMGIELLLGSTVRNIRDCRGKLEAVHVAGRWFSCETLLIAAGSVPDTEFLNDSGLLKKGAIEVTPELRTKDRNIFAIGDAIFVTTGDVHTPWTWPQASFQGKLAAANLYKSVPEPLKIITRVNAMNLFGLSLVVLGPPRPGAETISYVNKDDHVYRELYVAEGSIVGGVLVGDISGAGPLHTSMAIGSKFKQNAACLLKPRGRVFTQRLWHEVDQHRRKRFGIYCRSSGT